MKTLNFTVTNEVGIHGRPAVMLVKLAKSFPRTTITVKKGDKTVEATHLMMLMGLGVVKNDNIDFLINGGDEQAVYDALMDFAQKELS